MTAVSFCASAIAALWAAERWGRGRRKMAGVGLAMAVTLLGVTVFLADHPALVEKLLTRLVLPAGALWCVIYGAAAVCLRRGQRRAGLVWVGVWVAYGLAGSGQVGGAMIAALEAGYGAGDDAARYDAVMVLGGGTGVRPDGAPQLAYAGDRVRVAAVVWQRGQTPVLVASGTSLGGLDQPEARDLGAETAALWAQMGVPAAAVVTLAGPHNTATEIEALAQHARAAGWRRVGLVTSAWHLRRAMRLAERAGLDAAPIAADVRGGVAPWSAVAVVPTGSGFYRVSFASKEWLGALVGR